MYICVCVAGGGGGVAISGERIIDYRSSVSCNGCALRLLSFMNFDSCALRLLSFVL